MAFLQVTGTMQIQRPYDWRVDHLAGLDVGLYDPECGWCLSTWSSLDVEAWEEGEGWVGVPARTKRIWRGKLRRFRQGRFWW